MLPDGLGVYIHCCLSVAIFGQVPICRIQARQWARAPPPSTAAELELRRRERFLQTSRRPLFLPPSRFATLFGLFLCLIQHFVLLFVICCLLLLPYVLRDLGSIAYKGCYRWAFGCSCTPARSVDATDGPMAVPVLPMSRDLQAACGLSCFLCCPWVAMDAQAPFKMSCLPKL